jgi:tetratricopeptide (TPR) repeat protein
VCHQQLGDAQQARACYTQLLEIDPSHAIGLYNQACLHNEAGELAKSQALLKQSLRSDALREKRRKGDRPGHRKQIRVIRVAEKRGAPTGPE